VLSETAFVVLKRESYGVEGEHLKLLAFGGQLKEYKLKEVGVNNRKRFCCDKELGKVVVSVLNTFKSLMFLNLGVGSLKGHGLNQ